MNCFITVSSSCLYSNTNAMALSMAVFGGDRDVLASDPDTLSLCAQVLDLVKLCQTHTKKSRSNSNDL